MPLSQKVSFSTRLQRQNRIVVPKLIREEFKLETSQVLNIGANDTNTQSGWHFFYAKMTKDGRIVIPKLTLTLLREEESADISGDILEVTLEPARA